MFIKKLGIYSLTIITLVGIGVGLACSIILPAKYNSNISDPWSEVSILYNSKVVNDKSFNQAQQTGVDDYESSFGYKVKQFIPSSTLPTARDFNSMITTMIQDGSKGIFSATFQLSDSMMGPVIDYSSFERDPNSAMVLNNQDTYFILVDDNSLADYSTVNWGTGFDKTNIVQNGLSIIYNSNHAGFIASLAASLYSTYISKELGTSNYVSTWGGLMFNNVYDWLSGYEQGVNWFNYAILGVDPYGNEVTNVVSTIAELTDGVNDGVETLNKKSEGFTPVQILNGKSSATELVVDYNSTRINPSMWYTNSFNPGDGEDMASNLVNLKSNVIFPVAGGQIGDAMNQASGNTKVIGVDVDQTNVYSTQRDVLLGSATKNMSLSTELGMWYAERFVSQFNADPLEVIANGNNLDVQYYNDYIDSTSSKTWVDSTNSGAGNFMGVDNAPSLMTGTYANNGVGWIDSSQNSDVEIGIEKLNLNSSFDSIINTAFKLNSINDNILIENSSPTFATLPSEITLDEVGSPIFGWVPDWSLYY